MIWCRVFVSLFVFFAFPLYAAVDGIDEGLPKFLIIGAQKSGTRALYEILRQHPQVVDRPGEVHFFDIYFDKGVDWYKAQFPQATASKSIRGDKSPYYLFHPLAPKRAFSLLPHAKLIVLLRNPVDRAYSHYWMNVRNKKETLSFGEAIAIEKYRLAGEEERILKDGTTSTSSNHRQFSYLARGLYAEQLKRWLDYYPSEQIWVISFDDFVADPQKIVNEVLLFLGLPEYNGFNFQAGIRHSHPPIDANLHQELFNYFRPHNEQLEMLLNRKFNW